MKRIVSAENAHFRNLLKLAQSSRERRKAGLSLLDGVHLVAAYREHYGMPVEVAVSETALERAEIRELLEKLRPLEPLLLSDALFAALSTVSTPTGIVASIATPRMPALPERLESCLLLEDIQDPGNLGAILRSAAGAGIRHVCLSKTSVHSWSPRVLRAGMGAHFMLSIHEQCDLIEIAHSFPGRVIATVKTDAASVFATDLTGNVALVLGNEGAGISPRLQAVAQARVTIPMPGPVESLNVSAAAAICLFERVRQLAVVAAKI